MNFEGRIKNGMVVTNQPLPLRDGTLVRVEPILPQSDFWKSKPIDELAREQGVSGSTTFEDLLGGWPADELDDGFEQCLEKWRRAGSESG
jgi:hypothetical protein